MSKSARLRTVDARALFQLAGECRDLGDDPATWRAHLFRRLCRLTGADLGVGGETARQGGGVFPTGTVGWGWENGFDPSVLARELPGPFANLLASPHMGAYFARAALDDGPGLTRQDLVPDPDWVGSPYFRRIHEPIGVDHVLLSFRHLRGTAGECSGLTFARRAGNPRDFSARDRALVREAHAVVVPLVGGALARFVEPSPAALSPRARQVLRCLLEGDSDKQAAARLGISPLTVNVYTKAIYRHFGVGGRAELLARWVRRGWGARCAWADGPA